METPIMDASHINRGQSPASAGRTGASLPAPGTVIMASVEQDLGEGKYSLRWSGQRITVSSQTALTRGQSLILKSEASAEGRTRLVVQGPALPESGPSGRIIYRPGKAHGGDGSQAARPDGGMEGRTGAPVAASLARAAVAPTPQSLEVMLGAVLEPLDDFQERALQLFRAAQEEKKVAAEGEGHVAADEEEPARISFREQKTAAAEQKIVAREQRSVLSGMTAQKPTAGAESAPMDQKSLSPEQKTAQTEAPPASTPQGSIPGEASSVTVDQNPAPTGQKTVVDRVQFAPGESGTASNPDAPSAEAPPESRPQIREALTRAAMMAEQPMPERTDAPAAAGGRMPEAIVDKAATLLLRAAGIDPEEAALDAGRALIRSNAPVDRETVAAIMEFAAGADEAGRGDVLRAAARLAAKDIPLAEPLVAGLAAALDRRGGAQELLLRAEEALSLESAVPDAEKLKAEARELLALMRVDLNRADAADVLERFASTFGREALGKTLALVETATQAVLENDPFLQKVDEALGALLRLLGKDIVQEGPSDGLAALPPGGEISETIPAPDLPELTIVPETPTVPATPAPLPGGGGAPINAYLNAPKAVSVEALLSRLPAMPQLARLDMPFPQSHPSQPRQQEAAGAAMAEGTDPGQAASVLLGGRGEETGGNAGPTRQFLNEALLFQTPGANRPELELLQPSGLLQRFLSGGFDHAEGPVAGNTDGGVLLRKLLSDTPEHVREALRQLPEQKPEVLREVAARLTRMETESIRENAALGRLADAAGSLRDLGRQMLAAKAENLAGADREPGVMLAEIPFKLGDQAGDGRMQMFYRRAKKQAGGWSSRVILDLNTTRMGPLLGDLRFFGQDVTVNIFVETEETAAYLERSGADLGNALSDKGFRVKTRFMVIPQAAVPSPKSRENTGGSGDIPPTGQKGRLDVKG